MKKMINKTISVQLESPWKFSSGGIGKALLENPPKGIRYVSSKSRNVISSGAKMKKIANLKKTLGWISGFFPLIKSRNVDVSNGVDVLHCEHFLCKNKDINWVVDNEGFWQFFIGKRTIIKKKRIESLLSRPNCKKIITWTRHAAEELKTIFPNLAGKITFLYPAVPYPRFKKKKKKDIVLLFVGRYFYQKGGLHALEAMDRITRRKDSVRGIYVGPIPEEYRKKYSQNKKLKILGSVSHDKLISQIYPNADIFLYPGYTDSFGFAYLEAMSFGLPVVTIKKYNTEEIIDNGKTGFMVDLNLGDVDIKNVKDPAIEKFCYSVNKLLDKKIVAMGQMCRREIKNGKFSIEKRNKKLREIYLEAING